MKILIINCGSSSLKYKLIDMANEKDIIEGIIERIGLDQSRLVQKNELREKYILEKEIKDHLEKIMPEYISKAYSGKMALDKLVR